MTDSSDQAEKQLRQYAYLASLMKEDNQAGDRREECELLASLLNKARVAVNVIA